MTEGQTTSQFDYLQDQINSQLKRIETNIYYYRKRHYFYQSVLVVISVTITIISGLNSSIFGEETNTIRNNTILILGALSTLFTAFGAFSSPQQSWHLNSEAYCKIRSLQTKINFSKISEKFKETEDKLVQDFFMEYQNILDEYNLKWQELRKNSKI